MKFNSWLYDSKVRGVNVALEMTIQEYANLAPAILANNSFQRRRVQSKGKVYHLLGRDIMDGCVIPPLILAVTSAAAGTTKDVLDQVNRAGSLSDEAKASLETHITEAIESKALIILDGLQRTYTIQDCTREATHTSSDIRFLEQCIRLEVYVGLNKSGILYRMLTLNTGQTPMSFRHQIEILYHDYIEKNDLPDNIKIFRESDSQRARGKESYTYQAVCDMYYAFTTGNPKSVGKEVLIDKLKEMDFIEDYTPSSGDMLDLLKVYNRLIKQVDLLAPAWQAHANTLLDEGVDPFGTNIYSIFTKVQPMCGFGAECHRLIKLGIFTSLSEIEGVITRTRFAEAPEGCLAELLKILDEIKTDSKKIGDSQRLYFQLLFRMLLTPTSDSFQDLGNSWLAAQQAYTVMYSTNASSC